MHLILKAALNNLFNLKICSQLFARFISFLVLTSIIASLKSHETARAQRTLPHTVSSSLPTKPSGTDVDHGNTFTLPQHFSKAAGLNKVPWPTEEQITTQRHDGICRMYEGRTESHEQQFFVK